MFVQIVMNCTYATNQSVALFNIISPHTFPVFRFSGHRQARNKSRHDEDEA